MTAVGETLGGKYRFERLLGEGGMGAVYAAENLNTGRRVAVKVLRGDDRRGQTGRSRANDDHIELIQAANSPRHACEGWHPYLSHLT